MTKLRSSPENLTDEQVLKEFVRRFQCDGAVLVYMDSANEFGFGRWRNSQGKEWVKDLFKRVKQPFSLIADATEIDGGMTIPLST